MRLSEFVMEHDGPGDLNEFAPGSGSDDDGNDGFSDDTLKQLAAQWYNGDEDPRVESTLMAAGWEIGRDEGYDDTPGVFVVQAGDINGNSYISWAAQELEGLTETTGSWVVYNSNRVERFKTRGGAVAYAEKNGGKVASGEHYHDNIQKKGIVEGSNDDSPVAGAITRRILSQRLDLLKQYGPGQIVAAVDNVAYFVGDVEEIGSSDVSAWVAQVERMLKENPPEAFNESNELIMKEYFDYLEALRKSGVTNMFGAAPYLEREFGMDEDEAVKILKQWMVSFRKS